MLCVLENHSGVPIVDESFTQLPGRPKERQNSNEGRTMTLFGKCCMVGWKEPPRFCDVTGLWGIKEGEGKVQGVACERDGTTVICQ